MDIDARAFGQLEGEVKALAGMLAQQNDTLAQQNAALSLLTTKLDAVSTTLSEARGGWRTLLWLSGASAAVAGLVTWALQHMAFR